MFSSRNLSFTRPSVTRPLAEVEAELHQWLESGYGDYLLQQQRLCLRSAPTLPGYHLLQLGMTPAPGLLADFPHLHRFSLSSGRTREGGAAVADFAELPLPCDCIDTVLLHHALDFSAEPHAVLREAVRVLMPGGHIVIFGFNPLGPWGLSKPFGQFLSTQAVWRYNSLLRGRIADWLTVLHCAPIWSAWGGYQPPGSTPWWREKTPGLDRWGQRLLPWTGAFYALIARKTVARPIVDKGLRWSGVPVPSLALQRMAAVKDGKKVRRSA